MSKKVVSSILAVVLVLALSVSALAASNCFSGITGKMNSFQGKESGPFSISSGSVPYTAKVSGITLTLQVSTGSDPFYLVVYEPNGKIKSQTYITGTGGKTVNLSQFNGLSPSGSWKVSIVSTGLVSTATGRMVVNYSY